MSLEIIKKLSEEAIALQNKMYMEETFHKIIALVEAEFAKFKAAAVITPPSPPVIVTQPIQPVITASSVPPVTVTNPVSDKKEDVK